MAQPTVISASSKFLIYIESPDSPNVFIAPCGLTTKGITYSKAVNEVIIPDCDNPEEVAWTGREAQSKSCEISGSGVLAMETNQLWHDFYDEDAARTCRVVEVDALGGTHEGNFHLTNLAKTGAQGEKVNVEITLQSDGPVIFTQGSP